MALGECPELKSLVYDYENDYSWKQSEHSGDPKTEHQNIGHSIDNHLNTGRIRPVFNKLQLKYRTDLFGIQIGF